MTLSEIKGLPDDEYTMLTRKIHSFTSQTYCPIRDDVCHSHCVCLSRYIRENPQSETLEPMVYCSNVSLHGEE